MERHPTETLQREGALRGAREVAGVEPASRAVRRWFQSDPVLIVGRRGGPPESNCLFRLLLITGIAPATR